MVKEKRYEPPRAVLEDVLLKDGINIALVQKMAYTELLEAYRIEDYIEYNHYMAYMAHKYDI